LAKIKVHRVDKIKTVLGFLTSLSQEKFITKANPGLGVPINKNNDSITPGVSAPALPTVPCRTVHIYDK